MMNALKLGSPVRSFVVAFVAAAIFLSFINTVQATGSGVIIKTKKTKTPKTPPNTAISKDLTITKVDADPKQETIKLYFTNAVTMDALRDNLKVFPPVDLKWWESTVQPDNTVTIKGEFRPGQEYKISLPEGFESIDKKRYVKGVTGFKMPDLPFELSYPEKGYVIERDSRQMLSVSVTNVDEILFSGMQVPPVMLPAAMEFVKEKQQDRPWDKIKARIASDFALVVKAAGQDADFKVFMRPIQEDSQAFFPKKELNTPHIFSIPMEFRHEKEKGSLELALIESRKSGQPARTHPQLLAVTDIGITYKLSGSGALIWATSLHTGRPVAGVSVLAVTKDNNAVYAGRTGDDGRLIIPDGSEHKTMSLNQPSSGIKPKPLNVKAVAFIAAATDTDASYIEVKPKGSIIPAGYKQAIETTVKEQLLNGEVFTERGVYRPGETVYFKGTVRRYKDGVINSPEGLECLFTVTNPRQETVYQKKLKLSDFGTASDSFRVEKFLPLGTYTLTLKYGAADDDKAETTFSVHEFVPPRHFTRMGFRRESRPDTSYVNLTKTAEFLICDIEGRYYAGGPVKNGRVRWTAYKAKTDYQRKDYPDHTFGYPQEGKDNVLESGESLLDASGKISVSLPIGKEVLSGMEGVEVDATVVDFDGRAASGSSTYQAESDFLVGIASHPESIKTEDPQSIQVIAIGKDGKKIKEGSVTARVMERDWTSVPTRNAKGEVRWEGQTIWRQRLTADVPVKGGEAVFDFDFAWGGNFLITFTYKGPDGRSYVSGTTYNVDGYEGYNYDEIDNANPVERVNLLPEKESYKPGDTARVYINQRRPMSSALLTVERDGVLESRVIKLAQGQRTIDIPVKESYYPNVYVSLLGTVEREEFPLYTEQFDKGAPTFLYGVVSIAVQKETGGLTVEVAPGEKRLKSLPGADATVKLTCKDQDGRGVEGELAVCVVDESVLALTGFKTPDLSSVASFDAPLSVFTGDLRSMIMRQTPYAFMNIAPLTGGDGGEAMQKLGAKLRKDFNPVAYFNPSVLTNKDGNATVSFKFPDTMTEYRIYAVACDRGSRFGSAQKSAVVVKDFYIEPGLPRFFTRGDAFIFNVSAFNKTELGGKVSFSVKPDERLTLTTSGEPYPIKATDSVLMPVAGKAEKPGSSTVTFMGTMGGRQDSVELKIPVNSGYILDNDFVFGTFRQTADIKYAFPKGTKDIPWENLNPDELQATLTVSGSPFLRMSCALKYLLHYPYGCIEQTSSGVIGLAGLRSVVKQGLIPDITTDDTDKYLRPGLERLISMQTESGGFGYWPGDRQPHTWGSIYAAYALTLGRQAGFSVPQDRLDKALGYLSGQLNDAGKSDPLFKGYAAYILALNGRLDQAALKDLSSGLEKQQNRDASVLALLAAKASGHVKDKEVKALAEMLLSKPRPKPADTKDFRWYGFYAPYREYAVELLAATEILPGSKEADDAARKLLAGMDRRGIWTSTSDTGWALIALGRYFKGATFEKGEVKGTVRQGGKEAGTFSIGPSDSYSVGLDIKSFLANPKVSVNTDSGGALIYRLALTYPRADYAAKGYSNGFEVYKEITNIDGTKHIKVGDVVEVKVRIQADRANYSYVVLDDPLPAGLVAINSALKTEERLGGRPDDEEAYWWSYWDAGGFYRFQPNFVEMRDDRVLAFKNYLWKGPYQYSYYARAVCEGEFVMPQTKVQLMYEPDIAAYTPLGKVVIEGNR